MKNLIQNFKISKFKFLMVGTFFALLILSCAKDENNKNLNKEPEVSSRSVLDCGPDLENPNCTSTSHFNVSIPTILGCNAVVNYKVLECTNNSTPPSITSIAVYDVDIQYSIPSCNTLVDSIIYYVTNGNQIRANYLQLMFNRIVTSKIESIAINDALDDNPLAYQCGNGALVNLDFFSSKCYKFCVSSKKQVYCGVGCCKRATGYCYKDGILQSSVPNISQSSPCESIFNPCEVGTDCAASACEILIPVSINGGGI